MSNLFKCETCKKILTEEETKNHKQCTPNLTKFKTIQASSFFITENDRNEPSLAIDGLNGIGYTFIIKEPKLIPLELPCDSINLKVTPRRSTEDETEPNFSIVLYYAQRKSRYNGICLRCIDASQTKERCQ